MNAWTKRSLWLVVLLALAVLSSAAWVYRAMWTRYEGALDQLESRSERLDGLVNAGPEIEAQLGAARQSVAPWLHAGGEAAQNDVQQKLRELIGNAGLTLVSSQAAVEPGTDGKLERIRFTATVSGDWLRLVRFSESLQVQRPPFWVRTATISRDGVAAGPGPQNARMTLQLDAPLAPASADKPADQGGKGGKP